MSTDREDGLLSGQALRLHEGTITLPQGYEDRTTNVLVPADPSKQPNFSIARDWLQPQESLEQYVDRQCQNLRKRIPGLRLEGRDTVVLGQDDRTLHGIVIRTRYSQGTQGIWQRQAAFLIVPRRALLFTAASPSPPDDSFDALWHQWLGSFTPTERP